MIVHAFNGNNVVLDIIRQINGCSFGRFQYDESMILEWRPNIWMVWITTLHSELCPHEIPVLIKRDPLVETR